jgi:hypothetical protein
MDEDREVAKDSRTGRFRPFRRLAGVGALLSAGALIVGCAGVNDQASTSTSTSTTQRSIAAPAPPPPVSPAEARAERAVTAFSAALRAGDVEQLCRPNGVFTAAVVDEMNGGDESCEVTLELSSVIADPPVLHVTSIAAFKPDLATVRVRIAGGATIPLDVVRDSRHWRVSFSDGIVPMDAIAAHQ